MEKEYMFHCRGCEKPDKDFPVNFDDYDYGEKITNCPRVSEHMWAEQILMVYIQVCIVVNVMMTQRNIHIEKMNTLTQLMLEKD